MLEKFIYENHKGQRFIGLENGVYLNQNDLRDYSWSYETINNKISRFHRSVRDRKLPLVFAGLSAEKATAAKNRLLEIAEADIEARLPGKIFIGEYYTLGYITASAKTNYLLSKRYCNIDLTFTSDDPIWYKETTYVFLPTEDASGAVYGGTIEYPYDYSYDYSTNMTGRRVGNDSVSSSAFRLRIYGEAANPMITIGGNVYQINGTVEAGATLLIDSITKTIVMTDADGYSENWFDKRGRTGYIFTPIAAGMNTVNWSGLFGFDLTVIEKRSEPKWT